MRPFSPAAPPKKSAARPLSLKSAKLLPKFVQYELLVLPSGTLISRPDPLQVFFSASLTHGFHPSFFGVFYLESIRCDNALDFIAESLYKRVHAPSSYDGFLLCTHNIRDQRRISTLFRKRQQTKSELGHIRRRRRCPMQAWGEFGFRFGGFSA